MAKRERRKLTPAEVGFVEKLSAIRLPLPQIAAVLGMHKSTLERCSKKDNAVRDAIEKGRARGSQSVLKTAFGMATSGDCPAMTIFWLKTQEGFRETTHLEVTGKDGGPIRTLETLTPEQRRERLLRMRKNLELTDDE